MSRSRTVPTGPAPDWDLSHAQVHGAMEAVVFLTEAFRRYGAYTVSWGYRGVGPDGEDEPDPSGPVTYFCEIEILVKIKGRPPFSRTLTGEAVAEPGGMSGDEAQVEAGAKIARQLGGRVQLVSIPSN